MKLFEKKLGAYYLVEFRVDKDFYYIQLYKKLHKKMEYEATDSLIKFIIKDRDKALTIYNGINLKNMNDIFGNEVKNENNQTECF